MWPHWEWNRNVEMKCKVRGMILSLKSSGGRNVWDVIRTDRSYGVVDFKNCCSPVSTRVYPELGKSLFTVRQFFFFFFLASLSVQLSCVPFASSILGKISCQRTLCGLDARPRLMSKAVLSGGHRSFLSSAQ